MSRLSRGILLVLWVVSLVVATQWGARAQQSQQGTVLSGPDLGFRVEGQTPDAKPYGKFVVRVNGQWVEVGSVSRIVPAPLK
jgi:hypothetical protein